MDDHDFTALQQRLDSLEAKWTRQEARLTRLKAHNWLLSWALLGLLAVCALTFILSAADPWNVQGVVRAKSFVVVDDIGNNRAELGVAPNGTCGLFLRDDMEDTRMMVVTEYDGTPGLTVYDSFGKARAMLTTLYDGTPQFGLYDARGKKLFLAP
jgi:hypothetical protein